MNIPDNLRGQFAFLGQTPAFLLLVAGIIFTPLTVAAKEAGDGSAAPQTGWIAGGGFVLGANPYVGDPDGVSTFVPLVGYFGKRLTWLGPYLNYKVFEHESGFNANLTASYRFQGFDYDGDDPRLSGLSDREPAANVGGSIARAGLRLSAMADVSGTHDGYELGLSYSHDFKPNRRTKIALSANLKWQSADLIDYYYGVSLAEATPSRPVYKGSAGTNFGIGADLNFFVTRRWMVLVRTTVTALADDVVDSPIVEDDYETSAVVGLVYRF